jgi:hypothetical protein
VSFAEKVTHLPAVSNMHLGAESGLVGSTLQSALAFNSLSSTAAKVKGGLVNAFKEVGDKVQKLPLPALIVPKHENTNSANSSSSNLDNRSRTDFSGSCVCSDQAGFEGTVLDSAKQHSTEEAVQSNEPMPAVNSDIGTSQPCDSKSTDLSGQSSACACVEVSATSRQFCNPACDSDRAHLQPLDELGSKRSDSVLPEGYSELRRFDKDSENCSEAVENRCSNDKCRDDVAMQIDVLVKPDQRLDSAAAPGPHIEQRVFSISSDENAGEIIFKSKRGSRSSVRRTKRTNSKQPCTLQFCAINLFQHDLSYKIFQWLF